MEVGSSGVCSRVRARTRNAGEVVQHLISASFDVVFEESTKAGMFSSDDHRFQQDAGTHVKLDESHSSRRGKHGGKGVCTALVFATRAQTDSLCRKHGGDTRSVCEDPACSTKAVGRGLCAKHGGKGTCTMPGCTTNAYARGLCTKHGGKGMCTVAACTTNAQARGLCTKHGGKGMCSVVACTTNAKVRGLCAKHGGRYTV